METTTVGDTLRLMVTLPPYTDSARHELRHVSTPSFIDADHRWQ
jgi:hypothetical protein